MTRPLQLTWVAILWLVAVPASADQFNDVRAWLERMATAMREQDYQGTFVYVRGDDVETIRLTHVRQGDEIHERLVAVSGPQREIVRDGQGVRAILGEQEQPLQDPLLTGAVFPDFSVATLERARERYLFEVGSLGRIAGHQGRKISIVPRDEYRYGYELWLEEQSALLLRWVLYDGNRRPLAKLMFTELATGEEVDSGELQSELPEQRFITIQAASPRIDTQGASEAQPLSPRHMPPGFVLAAHARHDDNPTYEHLVFSDGLASVSVYLEPAAGEGGIPQGLSRMGTTNAWSRSREERRVTAIGEVPPITLKTIGNAFLAPPAER